MNYLPTLTQRALNRPLLLHPSTAETVIDVLTGRIAPGALEAPAVSGEAPAASRFVGSHRRAGGGVSFVRAEGATAIITIDGSLVNRGAWLDAQCGLVSYEGIAAQVQEAADDSAIKNIVLDINSYGGEATGMFNLVSTIAKARETKHIVAVVNDVAASAAYGIASAADRIVVSPTSLVGSIGVVMLHLDRSAEMAAKGVRPTLIHAGAKKVDGNPFEALSDAVKGRLQADCDKFYAQFIEAVAAGRGRRLTAAAARKTEAGTYIGADAIRAGLADEIGGLDDVLADLAKPPPSNPKQKGSARMERELTYEQSLQQDAVAERQRIATILNSDAGKARPKAALTLALAADSPSAETAEALLATMPAEGVSDGRGSTPPRVPSLAERAAELGETGGYVDQGRHPENSGDPHGWKNAFARVNQGIPPDARYLSSEQRQEALAEGRKQAFREASDQPEPPAEERAAAGWKKALARAGR